MPATDEEIYAATTEMLAALNEKTLRETEATEAMQRWEDAGQAQVTAETRLAEATTRVGNAQADLLAVLSEV